MSAPPYGGAMCRNITTLRGLEPPATSAEVEAAALQFVRKVSGVASGPLLTSDAVTTATAEVAAATERLLAALPARRQPPATSPPLRRRVESSDPSGSVE
jgi:hypothetical protein